MRCIDAVVVSQADTSSIQLYRHVRLPTHYPRLVECVQGCVCFSSFLADVRLKLETNLPQVSERDIQAKTAVLRHDLSGGRIHWESSGGDQDKGDVSYSSL